MDVRSHNKEAWDRAVASGDRWTVPVDAATIARARCGDWEVVLTPTRPVPRAWFPELWGKEVLGLASGGGQQCPILAAAGAWVTSFDNSPAQLEQDRRVAEREKLVLRLVEGDMRNLSAFPDASFDLVFHPCSNLFVDDVRPVWRECFRVLKPGGALLSGFCNPVLFAVDPKKEERGELVLERPIPWSDPRDLPEEERRRMIAEGEPLQFGHTLEDQVAGQLDAGFVITGFYEDGSPEWASSRILPTFAATRAVKRNT